MQSTHSEGVRPGLPQRLAALFLGLLILSPSALAQLPDLLGPEAEEPTAETESIPVASEDGPGDEAIAERIRSLYASDAALEAVSIEVRDGIVTLSGTVSGQEAEERALALADRVEGTVLIVDRLESDLTVATRFRATLQSLAEQWRGFLELLPLLLVAGGILFVAAWLGRLVGRLEAPYARLSQNPFVQDLLRQVCRGAVFLAGLTVALMVLDATKILAAVAGGLGILGLAIGFATRDTVENYIASILLSLRQPFAREDFVLIDDVDGKVLRLTPRATVLMSLDGNHIRIPNARVFKATIVNYTRNPYRRFEFTVGVATDVDLAQPRQLALETLADLPGVLADPQPVCLVDALGDSSVVLRISAWVDQREHNLLKVKSEAQRLVKERFDAAGIVMPEPIYNVNLSRVKDAPATASAPQTDTATPPTPVPDSDPETDTRRDDVVEAQMRADARASERDLLDPDAPTE